MQMIKVGKLSQSSRPGHTTLPALLCMLCTLCMGACNGGLDPGDYNQTASFSGRIYFVQGAGAEHFPPKDSLLDLRVVAFHDQPKDTNLLNELGNGDAIFSALALVDSSFSYPADIPYSIDIPQNQLNKGAVSYRYVAVAQRYGPNILSDWKVVGIYSLDSVYTPQILILSNGTHYDNINFTVDFLHPPPQPFKR